VKPEKRATHATHSNDAKTPVLRKDWRLYIGVTALLLSIIMPFLAILVPYLPLPLTWKALIAGAMVLGGPEVFTIVAVALLGKETLHYFTYRAKKALLGVATLRPVSRVRYYAGMVLCILSILPLYAYGYLPGVLPAGNARLLTLSAGDFAFIASIFIMGSEFWEKLRRLFVWEGKA
jgi:hypothetical protein